MLTDTPPKERHDFKFVALWFSEADFHRFEVVKTYFSQLDGYDLKNPNVIRKLVAEFYKAIQKQEKKT